MSAPMDAPNDAKKEAENDAAKNAGQGVETTVNRGAASSDLLPTPPTGATPRRRRQFWIWGLLAVVVCVSLAAGLGYRALVGTPNGLTLLLKLVQRVAPLTLDCTEPTGTLYGGFTCKRLTLVAARLRVEIDTLHAELQPISWWPLYAPTLRFDRLTAERITVLTAPAPNRDPPPTLAPPVNIDIVQFQLGQYQGWSQVPVATVTAPIATTATPVESLGDPTVNLRDLAGSLAITPQHFKLSQGRLSFAGNPVTLEGTMGGVMPFVITAQGSVQSRLVDHPVQATWTAAGTLVDLQVQAQLSGGAARGDVRLAWASFSPQPLQRLQTDLTGIDPSAWWAAAPQAQLSIRSDLTLRSGGNASNASNATNASNGSRLGGALRIDNAVPGPLDQKRMPLRSLSAELWLPPGAPEQAPSAEATAVQAQPPIELRGIDARLTTGQVRGAMQSGLSANAPWQAALALEGIDLATLHTALRPLLIDGTVVARQHDGRQQVETDLRSRASAALPTAQLKAALDIQPDQIDVREAQLQLGVGSATATGNWDRRAARLRGSGQLQSLDVGVLLAAVQTRLNGSFELDATVAAQPAGSLRMKIKDSQVCVPPTPCQPLAGQAAVALDAARQLQVDADFELRETRIHAHGRLDEQAGSEATLQLNVDVPSLRSLLPAVSGSLKADATLGGGWRAPSLRTSITANGVRSGLRGANGMKAQVDYAGGTDGELTASVALEAVQWTENPATVLRSALLQVDGRPQAHRITLYAVTALDRQLNAAAQGGWRNDLPGRNGGPAWTGMLETFTSDLPLPIRLLAPASLMLGAQGVALGPASLAVAGGRVDELEFSNQDGRLRTRGRFTDVRLDPRRYSAEDPMAAIGANSADPLVVAGAWRLELDALAEGEWTLARTGGDLHPPGSRLGVGLRVLKIEGKVRANQLSALLQVDGERSGRIDAAMRAALEPTETGGWRIAQRRPWEGSLIAMVPDVAWLGPLLSDATAASLRIGGRFDADLKLSGTPAATRASGTLNGSGLTAGWAEQGVRLSGGTLQAHMEDDTLIVDALRFDGAARVAAADAATRKAVTGLEPGFVSATARIKLPELTGVVQVSAQRAAIVQRPDRWLMLTGGGNITVSPQRTFVQFTVHTEAGFIDFSQPDLPRLSQDVQVRRGGVTTSIPVTAPEPITANPPQTVAPDGASATATGSAQAAKAGNGGSSNGARRASAEDPRQALGFDISINLGPAFRLRGNGLDSRIEGLVRLRSEGRFAIRATGTVEAKDGVYEGFGQKLPITRGRVNFQGSLENPALDILAVRNDLPPDAGEIGVSVTRTALDPLIRLHSDPALPDVEALSWLVLGRQPERSGGDSVALARAAAGLFSGSGEGVQTRLARQLGIDEFSLRSGTAGASDSRLPRSAVAGNLRGDITAGGASSQFVTVGKRLNEALTLTYEQAVSGTGTVVQLSYRLSRRFNLIARAGTENAMDLVYSLSFD